jgi:hypothetical protein
MAKRKLSPEQRETIRKEIRQLANQKKKQAEIIRTMSENYKVSPMTARWYYKSVVRPGRPAAKARPGRRPNKVARSPKFKPAANGASLRMVQQVQTIADKNFKRVVEAKRLIPKWQIYVRREAFLRKQQDKVTLKLRQVTLKASELQRRIRALTSG